jgi:hypothetical protein
VRSWAAGSARTSLPQKRNGEKRADPPVVEDDDLLLEEWLFAAEIDAINVTPGGGAAAENMPNTIPPKLSTRSARML